MEAKENLKIVVVAVVVVKVIICVIVVVVVVLVETKEELQISSKRVHKVGRSAGRPVGLMVLVHCLVHTILSRAHAVLCANIAGCTNKKILKARSDTRAKTVRLALLILRATPSSMPISGYPYPELYQTYP